MNTDTISIVGLGKLGLCLAAIYAYKGKTVIGVDLLPNMIDNINLGRSPIVEPDLAGMISKVGGKKLLATLEHNRAIAESDITIVITATPSMPDGSFSNDHVEDALTKLSLSLKNSTKPYHLFVISSTVIPGSIEGSFIPLIERHSGRKLSQGFGICYDPDFVALGSVIKDFMNPEVVIIGESSSKDGKLLEILHVSICDNSPQICHMSLSSAEIAKVSLNAYITLKISFANLIGNICDKIQGANPDDITGAIGLDKRISPYYFKAGLSYGGTCFPRDTWALNAVLKRHNIPLALMQACQAINAYQDKSLIDKVINLVKQVNAKTIGILGLAFKPGTPVVTESPAIKLIKALHKEDLQIVAYDPLAQENTYAVFEDRIDYAGSIAECLSRSSLNILTIPSKEMAKDIYKYQGTALLLDCWRILNKDTLPKNIKCFHFFQG
ncbi:MAG: nucleotide sugar dehydrogenase [Treponema sp.]|jgi:UDPglucose 6-dehydrogenase|nr:nucleotide sugar dehydrogenase [Treponema sp.]